MVYRNSTPVGELAGKQILLSDVVDACLYGRLNLFLQGDSGTGKTQLAADAMSYFPDSSVFILGRNDMAVRDLFQQINLDKLRTGTSSSDLKELTDKIEANLIVVDELPNCVPAVRTQLFNLFDGYIEIDGRLYPIGKGYSIGIATGNIGQQFTESTNELGRALKDRMHVTIDVDHFFPSAEDTLAILDASLNPRVEFSDGNSKAESVIKKYLDLEKARTNLSFEKLIIANYLLHGLDYCSKGSKRKMKDAWPTALDEHEQVSDVGLILPISPRAAKSILRLSQSLDSIVNDKGVTREEIDAHALDSMMLAFRLVGAYSGILNESAVSNVYAGNKYAAIDAVITSAREQFGSQKKNIAEGIQMVESGKTNGEVLSKFAGRWDFMKGTLLGAIPKK